METVTFGRDASFQDYTDKVVAYYQYKAALDLTPAEATTHPDTLQAFGDIHRTVAARPELVATYTNVLRYSNDRQLEALATVRVIETNIVKGLYDNDIIGINEFQAQMGELTDKNEILWRAEQFGHIFKDVIPTDQLPSASPENQAEIAHQVTPPNQTRAQTRAQPTTLPVAIEGLRKGQAPALQALFDYVEYKGMANLEGYLVAPTGAGKTGLFAKFLEQLRQEGRLPPTVIVVPTKFLKYQTQKELVARGFRGKIQLAESTVSHDVQADVVIITQQAFARQLNSGGTALDASRVGLVIFDEAHHIGGEKTTEAIKTKLPHVGIVGFTASPNYDARRQLANYLPDFIHEIPMHEAVEWELIAPYQTILLPTHADLSFVVPTGNDYHQYLLNKALNTSPRNHLVARFLADHFRDELVIANVNTVRHAEVLAETMRSYGKDTLAVSGATKNLNDILDGFDDRKITGLVNAKILGEGLDRVKIEVVANVTSTLSEVREKQRTGRGQRIDPDNPAKVLKVVECVDDRYVKKPVLYGTLTGYWQDGGGKELPPFEPLPGYRVLQDPAEIDAWWRGDRELPHFDAEAFEARASSYTPVEPKIFAASSSKPPPVKRSRPIPPRRPPILRQVLEEEFNEAFAESEPVDPIENIRRIGGSAASFILDGSYPGRVTLLEIKQALRVLAGHPLLETSDACRQRYIYLQQTVAEHSQNPTIGPGRQLAGSYIRDQLGDKPTWQAQAACLGALSVKFYPGRGEPTKEAKQICAQCQAKDACLEFALANKEKFGIWGGLSEGQRRVVYRVRSAGEASAAEIQALITTMRGDATTDQDGPLDEFDDVFEQTISPELH